MKKLKVLVVDDVSSMRKFARFGLEKCFPGVSVEEASNGKDAQAKIESVEYDLILCDWEMPDMTGDEVLHWVRQHPSAKATPFIMVTSRNDKESVVKAIEAGANSYVVKPYSAEMLCQKITAVIDRFDRRRNDRVSVSGSTVVHFRDLIARGKLEDLSLGGIFGTFDRKGHLPCIFEPVVADIKLENDLKLNGISAFVIRIQAAEANMDTREVKVALKFSEALSPEKLNELESFFDALK